MKGRFYMATRKGLSQHLGASAGGKGRGPVGQRRAGRAAVSGGRSRQADRDRQRQELSARFSMFIQWSEADRVFIVTLPEFDDAKTHGDTYADAVKQGKDLIDSFIMWYAQDGQPLPKPSLFPDGEDESIEEPVLAAGH